jgi:hypothetical protein
MYPTQGLMIDSDCVSPIAMPRGMQLPKLVSSFGYPIIQWWAFFISLLLYSVLYFLSFEMKVMVGYVLLANKKNLA